MIKILALTFAFSVKLLLANGQQSVADYVRYDDRSVPDFDGVLGSFAPTAQDCVMQSTVAPMTNGVVYNDRLKTCKVLTTFNNELVVNLRNNTGWTTYVKDRSDTWSVVFKADAGQSNDSSPSPYPWNAFLDHAATPYTTNYTSSVGSLNRSTSCGCMYRNPIVDKLVNSAASQMQVLAILNGQTMASFTFNVNPAGTTLSDWFNKNNLVAAAPYGVSTLFKTANTDSYYDRGCYGCNIQSNVCRGFMIGSEIGGNAECINKYYLVTTTERSACCPCAKNLSPQIIFSYTLAADTCGSASVGYADFFVIRAKLKQRAFFV